MVISTPPSAFSCFSVCSDSLFAVLSMGYDDVLPLHGEVLMLAALEGIPK
jgi:hypothetical protein